MSIERISIRDIARTLSSLTGNESFAGEDDSGDFQILLSTLLTYIENNFALALSSYDTGWVSCSDWTNQHLGDSVGGNVEHNLNANLSNLIIKVLISTNGTDNNSFELVDASFSFAGVGSNEYWGIIIYQVDSNTIKVQTGKEGIIYLDDAGSFVVLDTESYYYKIKIYKLD